MSPARKGLWMCRVTGKKKGMAQLLVPPPDVIAVTAK
jgi:hypothetical protein